MEYNSIFSLRCRNNKDTDYILEQPAVQKLGLNEEV